MLGVRVLKSRDEGLGFGNSPTMKQKKGGRAGGNACE